MEDLDILKITNFVVFLGDQRRASLEQDIEKVSNYLAREI